MKRVLLACLGLLPAGCSDPVTQGDELFAQFGDTITAWEETGYEDYSARFAVRRTVARIRVHRFEVVEDS